MSLLSYRLIGFLVLVEYQQAADAATAAVASIMRAADGSRASFAGMRKGKKRVGIKSSRVHPGSKG